MKYLQILLTLFALSSPASAVTGDELLAAIDQNLTFESRTSRIRMTTFKGKRTKTYEMRSLGRGADEAAIEFIAPARDKGTRMLKKGDQLWMYLPSIEKTQKISGHMLRQGMMGSDFSYEDMMEAASWRKMYTATIVGEEDLEGSACFKLELKAKTDDVTYPRRLTWVDKETMIPLRQELYALSGMLVKTWTMSEVKEFDGRKFPTRMVAEDLLQKGSRTEMEFVELKFSVPLAEETFTTGWLER